MNGTLWKLGPQTFNIILNPGEIDVNFIAQLENISPSNPLGKLKTILSFSCMLGSKVIDIKNAHQASLIGKNNYPDWSIAKLAY